MTKGFEAETPGQLLREARRARGIDLAAAHDATKIPLRFLEALERDEYHQVSDSLYVKSFLRSYASWLELEAEQVLDLFERVAGDLKPGPDSCAPLWAEDQVIVRRVGGRSPFPLWITLIALAVLLLVTLVWFFFLPGRDQGPHSSEGGLELPAGQHGDPTMLDSARDESSGVAADLPTESTAIDLATSAGFAPRDLPTAVRGDSNILFQGGQTYELVLRIRLPAGANCSVSRDGHPGAMPVIWPEEHIPLPVADLRHGLVYAVRGGYAAYWGAADHFVVTLGDLPGVEVTLNGVAMPVERWRRGRPVVLDGSSLTADGDEP